MNELLHNLPVAETAAGSSVICKTLGQLPDYHKARRIMAFLSMPGEVDLDAFIEKALADDKEVYVPRCLDKGNMEGVRLYDLGQTVFDRYGIRTAPEGAPTCTADV
ncbi:MAG: 5-formyltetrahydrofolate cyclo-ligase, partial [Megasphaera micronuciformis]|nr:5-formyltetrahydrofolate cyclo-ligase [Megasphaera micronuciformis]